MAYDNDPYANMRDQPECCDDCPLVDACASRGMCGAVGVLFPLGTTGLQEQLRELETIIDNYDKGFLIEAERADVATQKLEAIREIVETEQQFWSYWEVGEHILEVLGDGE